MEYTLGYGKGTVSVTLPERNVLDVLMPNDVAHDLVGEAEVRRALAHPIGSPKLREIAKRGQKVAIVTSDISRPMPSYVVLPPVLEELNAAGVPDEDITIVLALGSHRAHTEAEQRALVGDAVFERVRVIDSDMNRWVQVGTTPDGTPVDMFEPVVEADLRVLLGNIEYHYFVGYSGGAKALMPGVSSRRAIQKNHSRMILPEAHAGAIESNPIRMDIEAILPFIPVAFICNVVLDEHKKVVRCVAGDVIEAHREGCKFLDSLYAVRIAQKADCVIVSQGGYPKDLNIYQAQKALDNARHAVKKGGTIIWVSSCKEGYGSDVFARWIHDYRTPQQCVEEIEKHFELGGHKAAAIAMAAMDAQLIFVNDLPEEMTRMVYSEPAPSVQAAVDEVLQQNPDATFLLMPYGGSTLPKCEA